MLSVIIPTFNEVAHISRLVGDLRRYAPPGAIEVLVVDGNSPDGTDEAARQAGATVLQSPRLGRAAQMNFAVTQATGEVLYFVHADVGIHPDYVADILQAIQTGFPAGCYRFRFDSEKVLLRINSFGTRFRGLMSRGGDQTLFVARDLFERLGGYDERFVIMEDFDFIRRLRRLAPFQIIPKEVRVSARKYETNSWLRVQLANLTAFALFFLRVAPVRIARTYKVLLNYR